MKSVRISLVLVLILALACVSATKADNHQSQSLTIVWAEWGSRELSARTLERLYRRNGDCCGCRPDSVGQFSR